MHTARRGGTSGRIWLGDAQGRDQRRDARLGRPTSPTRTTCSARRWVRTPIRRIVRDLQRVIGDEAAAQLNSIEGRLPDVVVACVGGGSNAIGIFSRFIGEPSVRLVAVEAAGDGIETGHHAAALAAGSMGIIHGARTMLLQDARRPGRRRRTRSRPGSTTRASVRSSRRWRRKADWNSSSTDTQALARCDCWPAPRASCPRSNRRTHLRRCRVVSNANPVPLVLLGLVRPRRQGLRPPAELRR